MAITLNLFKTIEQTVLKGMNMVAKSVYLWKGANMTKSAVN